MPQRDVPRYIALYRAGRLPVNKLMSGSLRLEQINAGFDRLAAFGAENPSWPNATMIRRRAEGSLWDEKRSAGVVTDFFAGSNASAALVSITNAGPLRS